MQKNTVSHFELYADDPEQLAKFYTSLFDWKVEPFPGDYLYVKTVDTDDKGMPASSGAINGGIARRPGGYPANGAVNYVSVESIEESVARATELGAKITKPKAAVPGMGWFAMLIDPQGNHFAVWKSDPGAK